MQTLKTYLCLFPNCKVFLTMSVCVCVSNQGTIVLILKICLHSFCVNDEGLEECNITASLSLPLSLILFLPLCLSQTQTDLLSGGPRHRSDAASSVVLVAALPRTREDRDRNRKGVLALVIKPSDFTEIRFFSATRYSPPSKTCNVATCALHTDIACSHTRY